MLQITIILYQVLSPSDRNILVKAAMISDFLLLLHFVSDPYIYVLLRNNRHRNTLNFLLRKILNTKPEPRSSLENDNAVDFNTNLLERNRASVVCFSSSDNHRGPTRGVVSFNWSTWGTDQINIQLFGLLVSFSTDI